MQFMKTVGMALNEDFVESAKLSLDQNSIHSVASYSCQSRCDLSELFGSAPTPLSSAAIAKVCLTDSQTVEQMLKQF